MTAQPAARNLGLAALGLAAFVVGTAELMVVGILDRIADDLDVSVSGAGALVTAYALGISLGGPALMAATIRGPRRPLIRAALALYACGNAIALAADSFALLVVSRALTGSLHGLFVGIAFAIAGQFVAPGKEGRAISIVFGGIMVATVVGVPLGSLIGQVAGWRAAFGAVVALTLLALAAALAFLPALKPRGTADLRMQARAAFRIPVLAMLAIGLVVMGGQFAALTYLAPYLDEVTGISGVAISVFLLVYGLAGAAGTFIGGKAADRDAGTTLLVANLLLVPTLVLLYALGAVPALAALLICCWGLVGMGLLPALQLRVITLAGPGGDLAATLGASAANAGIAGGSVIGGAVVAGSGAHGVVLAAAAICLLAAPASFVMRSVGAARPPAVAPREGTALAEPAATRSS